MQLERLGLLMEQNSTNGVKPNELADDSKGTRLGNFIFSFRYFAILAVVASLVGSVLLFLLGVAKTFKSLKAFATDFDAGNKLIILGLIEAIDTFLFGIVMLIFANGIFRIFIHRYSLDSRPAGNWFNVNSVSDLKKYLAQVIIVILFVEFFQRVVVSGVNLSWEMLVLPVSICLLSLSQKLLNWDKH